MQPTFFGATKARQINLGGASTTTSSAAILDGVKARRDERLLAVKRLVN